MKKLIILIMMMFVIGVIFSEELLPLKNNLTGIYRCTSIPSLLIYFEENSGVFFIVNASNSYRVLEFYREIPNLNLILYKKGKDEVGFTNAIKGKIFLITTNTDTEESIYWEKMLFLK